MGDFIKDSPGGQLAGQFESLSGAQATRANAKSQKNIAEYNAQVAEQEGKAAKAKAAFESEQQAEEAQRIKSSQIAALGAAGAVGSPVAIDIAVAQEKESTLENLLIGYEGEVLSLRADNAAALSRLQGEAAFRAGKAQARQQNIQFGIQLAGLAAGAAASDRRIKENIEPVSAVDAIKTLKAYQYNFIGTDQKRIGLMAQDVEKVLPAAVIEIDGIKHVDTYALQSLIISALGEILGN